MKKNLSKKEKALAPFINRDVVLKFTVRTIMNISDLHATAQLLFNNEQYGISRSVAILAKEELGKLVTCIFYLIGIDPVEVFLRNIRSHEHKQAFGQLWSWITSTINLNDPVQRQAFTIQASTFYAGMSELKDGIEPVVNQIKPSIEKEGSLIAGMFDSMLKGSAERTRQNGLYVSFELQDNKCVIRHPGMTTKEEALDELDGLEKFMTLVNTSGDLWGIAELDNMNNEEAAFEKIVAMLDQTFKPELLSGA